MPAEGAAPATAARSLVEGALALRRGEELLVATWSHTLPWAAAVVAEARRRGARVTLLLEDEGAFWKSLEVAPAVRGWAGPTATVRAAIRRADALLYFPGPADRPRLRSLPAELGGPFLGQDDLWLRLARSAGIRGVRCLLGHASEAQAEHWGVAAAMWRSRLLRGITEVDLAALGRDAARAARLLSRGRTVRVASPAGTELTFRLRGRIPWIDDGRVDAEDRRRGRAVATAPAGSIVVAIDESSAVGAVAANRPSFLSAGRVDGGEWEVADGRLRNYWYTEGGEAFEAEFGSAPRGRETVSLFALGLNPALPGGVPQAEDAEAGTATIAIGGNSIYGGRNPCRFLSWLTIGEATVSVDGTPLCDRGKIL
jgi:leucyl aminopeptidase (aminopeptidase T)